MNSSDSNSDSGWNKELIAAVSKKQGKSRIITEQDRIKQIKDCLAEGADVNAVDDKGNTALHTAVKKGYQMIVEFLRETGARTDIPNGKGITAVTLAENLGREDITNILRKPSRSRKSNFSSDDSLLDSSLNMPNRKRTTDAEDDNFEQRLKKIRLIDVPQPDLQHDVASVEQRSNWKRNADNELDEDAKRLRKLTLNDDAVDEETYDASGLKRSLHGTVYQLKHLMLILHRAWKKGYSFRLATEMDAADKFDDVVLRYSDSNGDEVFRFVQTKHRQDETKVIRASDLLDVKDGDFSLLKYFISWCKIKKHPDFGGNRLRNFILCTNIGLELDSLIAKNINVCEEKEPDDFLILTNRTTQPPRYKLLVENSSGLWDVLKSASNVHRLARELAERVCASQDIHLNTDIIKSYHVVLAKEVVDVREEKFYDNFIKDDGLSEKAAEFRKILFRITKQLLPEKDQSEECIRKRLGESPLKLSSNFGKETTKLKQTQFNELPDDQINDAEILRFFDEFILAVNQPNEVELGEMIKHEIGVHGQFNLPDVGFVRDSFQIEILDWFKTQKGKFLQKKNADDFFDEMKVKLGSLKTMALSLEYLEKLKQLGIQFKCGNTELENFINCPRHTSNQMLEVICSKQTLFTALRVCQILPELQKCEQNEGFIFVRLKTLLTPEIMKLVLPAFKWLRNYNLLIIDCESISAKQHLQTLWNPLCDIMAKNVCKRMIVITQAGKDLGAECSLGRQTYHAKNSDHSFDNLRNDSIKKLLGKQVTKFQGKINKTSFGELLGISDCDRLREDELKNLSVIMDSDILFKLISEDEIQIGRDLDGLDDIGAYYVNRTIFQHVVIKKDILKNKDIPDVLAVSGINRALPNELEKMGETFLMNPKVDLLADNSIYIDTPNESMQIDETSSVAQSPKNFITLDPTREEEHFNTLCVENENRNVHWLKKEQGKYIWNKSKGNITYLVEHRDIDESNDTNDRIGATYLCSEDLLAVHDEPVIISDAAGMGKSSMLTNLALKIKENKPDMLVLKINLNHHATALAEVTNKSSYNLCSIQGAVQFLVEKLLSSETDLDRKVFRRRIEKKHKVALILDGFDEISPTYEDTVMDLLQTLANYGIKKLIVATRPHTRRPLECKLNVFSYAIKPFSLDEQENYLTDYWKAKLQDSRQNMNRNIEERIKEYAVAIMEKLSVSIKDQSNKFTGNPLQARLVAEIFETNDERELENFESCTEFIDSEADKPTLPDKINLIYLYEHFVKRKFHIFFNKRGGNLADVAVIEERKLRYNMFIKTHERLALHALFDKDKLKVLLHSRHDAKDMRSDLCDLNIVVERDGIISQFIDGRPHFGRRTYAEYFAATFLSDVLKTGNQNQSLQKIFVADILLKGNYQTTRAFMNWLLSEDHYNALDTESWKSCLNEHRSGLNQTIFHVAAAEDNSRIIRLFFNCLGSDPEDRSVLINVKDTFGLTAVHLAIAYGQLDTIRLLVEHTNFEINSESENGMTPLHIAVYESKLDIVKYLIHKGANIDIQSKAYRAPLHIAVEKGELETVKYLIEKKANINFESESGWKPLHEAAAHGKLDIVKYLLDMGANIHTQDIHGNTPLHTAAYKGEFDVVKCLLDNEANVNCETRHNATPLHKAILQDKVDVAKYLVDKGANVNAQDIQGLTPLNAAALKGLLDLMKYLVDKGANINFQLNHGNTLLHGAAYRGKLEIVKCLLDNGANVNSETDHNMTPLHLAILEDQVEVAKYLLDKGANINAQEIHGSTPLHLAAFKGLSDLTEHLVDKGANINSQDNHGKTPLHAAALSGKLEVVKYLLDNGANVNSKTNNNKTPLYTAISGIHVEITTLATSSLVTKYNVYNAQEIDSIVRLWTAAINDRLDLVKRLLNDRAEINSRMNQTSIPRQVAIVQYKWDLVNYLVQRGAHF